MKEALNVSGVCSQTLVVSHKLLQTTAFLNKGEVNVLNVKAPNYVNRIIDGGCGRTIVHRYEMLSGQVQPCSVGLNGIDPQGNVKNQLRAVASGDLELRLFLKANALMLLSKALCMFQV